MGIEIEYKFRSFQELTNLVEKFNNFSIIEIVIMLLTIAIISVLVLYILPALSVYFNMKKRAKESENKKIALKQILIQKEIESDVQKEIENEITKS